VQGLRGEVAVRLFIGGWELSVRSASGYRSHLKIGLMYSPADPAVGNSRNNGSEMLDGPE
jgi:hypothetical protein